MMDVDSRVNLVNSRVRARRRVLANRAVTLLSVSSTALLALLVVLVGSFASPRSGDVVGLYGTMILFDQAGGYIIVALVSFIAAVAITLACIKYRRRHERRRGDDDSKKDVDHE